MIYMMLQRLFGVLKKEWIQIIRDKYLLGMIIILPIMQITIFGYAIGLNPRNLSTVIVANDHSQFTRAFIQAMHNTDYFSIKQVTDEKQADYLLDQGKAKFIVHIPVNFTKDLIQGEQPQILVEADASDPLAIENAIVAIQELTAQLFNDEFTGSLAYLAPSPDPIKLVVHKKFNPAGINQYFIVPGLIGVILTMTMIMITSMAITREYEHGTLETLLSTPVRPLEIMLGKVLPYVMIGYMQVSLVLIIARVLFNIPIEGSLVLLFFAILPFILANLMVGITISTIARNQLQALQMSIFFFLPSILLSGFTFPYEGMPEWAQWIGSALPLTHFLRIIRGIMLKGNDIFIVWHYIWPILIFITVVLSIALNRYRRTLD